MPPRTPPAPAPRPPPAPAPAPPTGVQCWIVTLLIIAGVFLGLVLSHVELRSLQQCMDAKPADTCETAAIVHVWGGTILRPNAWERKCRTGIGLGNALGLSAIMLMTTAAFSGVPYPGEYFIRVFLHPVIAVWTFFRTEELDPSSYFFAFIWMFFMHGVGAVLGMMVKADMEREREH